MSTENVINKLCNDLEPVKALQHPLLRAQPWAFAIIAYIIIASFIIGIRSDISVQIKETIFLFEVIIATAIGISALIATFWSTVPDMRGQKWVIAIPFVLLTMFTIWFASRAVGEHMLIHDYGWHSCFGKGLVLSAIPIAFSVFIAQKAASTHAYVTTFLSALSAGAFGFVALRFTCMDETIEHAVLHHLVPFLVTGIIAGTLAKRICKW